MINLRERNIIKKSSMINRRQMGKVIGNFKVIFIAGFELKGENYIMAKRTI